MNYVVTRTMAISLPPVGNSIEPVYRVRPSKTHSITNFHCGFPGSFILNHVVEEEGGRGRCSGCEEAEAGCEYHFILWQGTTPSSYPSQAHVYQQSLLNCRADIEAAQASVNSLNSYEQRPCR